MKGLKLIRVSKENITVSSKAQPFDMNILDGVIKSKHFPRH